MRTTVRETLDHLEFEIEELEDALERANESYGPNSNEARIVYHDLMSAINEYNAKTVL